MAASDPAAAQQNELLEHMNPEDVPQVLKDYMATTSRSDKPYSELTVEEKFGWWRTGRLASRVSLTLRLALQICMLPKSRSSTPCTAQQQGTTV
jgi:hypothetical protein